MLGGTKIPLLGLILVAFGGTGVYASRITFKAYPNILKANLTTAASMRCALEDTEVTRSVTNIVTNTDEDIAHVTAILITNNDGSVAHASAFDAPITLTDHGNLEVNADVSGNSTEGYLQLTWKIPSLISTGEYACQITTIDSHHHFTVFRSTLEMSMETPSINDVVVMFQTQNQQLKDLTEKDAKDTARNAALEQKLDALKQQDEIKTQILVNQTLEIASLKQQDVVTSHMLANQSVEVLDLKTCASTQAAFMAVLSSTSDVVLGGDTPVIYDKVVTNTDGGYDPRTGQFKVSTPGVYLLSVSVGTYGTAVELNILINSVKITSTTFYPVKWASGFASAVIILKKDDIVHVETEAHFSSSHKLIQSTRDRYQPNVFQGTLLHSDNCVF